jgi:hypothetical protein
MMAILRRLIKWIKALFKKSREESTDPRIDQILTRLDKLSRFFASAGGHRKAGKKLRALLDPDSFFEEQATALRKATKEVIEAELKSIIGSQFQEAIKRYKGELGEVVVYGALERDYKIVIPVGRGQPVDFIGIKDDRIDFIEVKTGGKSLSKGESKLKELVQGKQANYILYKINRTIPEVLDQKGEDEFLR